MQQTGSTGPCPFRGGQKERLDVITAFQYFPELLREGYINVASYRLNLLLVYVFSVLGAIPTVLNIVRSDRNAKTFSQMGEER